MGRSRKKQINPKAKEDDSPVKRIRIYCEGDTENGYFKYMNDAGLVKTGFVLNTEKTSNISENLLKKIERKQGHKNTTGKKKALADPQRAKDDLAGFSAIYCVFDFDKRKDEIAGAVAAMEQLNEKGLVKYRYICFNMCVETWFRLHFEDASPPNLECAEVSKALKKVFQKYKKNPGNEVFKELFARLEDARKRLKSKENNNKIDTPEYEQTPWLRSPGAVNLEDFFKETLKSASVKPAGKGPDAGSKKKKKSVRKANER